MPTLGASKMGTEVEIWATQLYYLYGIPFLTEDSTGPSLIQNHQMEAKWLSVLPQISALFSGMRTLNV